ncbi:hypothetical protein POTOM_013802 [Populus tomentosa]|uniref:Uncharacterized protein n=1 Tax=Populus tomentosa TaxID=118781 RepID=A0A8X8A1G1_POPTO|nr:hypothetical protein POTOM_013802 [Populus tomentosa]
MGGVVAGEDDAGDGVSEKVSIHFNLVVLPSDVMRINPSKLRSLRAQICTCLLSAINQPSITLPVAPSKVVPIREVAANELNVETRMTSEKAMETPKRLISLLKRELHVASFFSPMVDNFDVARRFMMEAQSHSSTSLNGEFFLNTVQDPKSDLVDVEERRNE